MATGTGTLALTMLGAAVLICLSFNMLALSIRYSLDYAEAPLVDQAMRLLQGENIYRPDISTPPYTISNYPPLFILALTPFVALFGPTFTGGRFISMLCTWLVAICIGILIKRLTGNRLAAWVSGMLFVAIPFVVRWSSLLRIDMLALALSMFALVVLTHKLLTTRRLIVVAVLLTAAIYTRQSYALAAPFAAFVWLFANHGWRRALVLTAWVAGLSAVLFGLLMLLTGGGFYFNIVTANINTWEFDRVRWNAEAFLKFGAIMTGLGGLSLLLFYKRTRVWTLTAPYLIGATASALTIGKIGSNVNYLMEFCAGLCLGIGAVLAWSASNQKLKPLLAAGLGVLALQTLWLGKETLDNESGLLRGRQTASKDLIWLENIVLQSDGQVLGDEHMGMLTLSNKPLLIQPFEVTQLANDGLWDQQPLLNAIRERKFSHILIHDFPGFPVYKERWTPEMLNMIQSEYSVKQKLGGTWVYVPRQSLLTSVVAPTPEKCVNAPWRLPSDAQYGVRWNFGAYDLQFLGRGNQGKVPVVAVADGLVTRRADWDNMVAVQHDDPLKPGKKIWSLYFGMASEQGAQSYISEQFPKGTVAKPIKTGEVIGQQGMFSGQAFSMWLNVAFGVVEAKPNGNLPDDVLGSTVDPGPYLGLELIPIQKSQNTQPLKCAG
jgi:hypothetical protein